MAYPFGWNPPSLEQFIHRCCNEYDCSIYDLQGDLLVNNEPITPQLLIRKVDGVDYHVHIPDHPMDCLLDAHLIAHMCRRLGIESEEFGVSLDDDTGQIIFREPN